MSRKDRLSKVARYVPLACWLLAAVANAETNTWGLFALHMTLVLSNLYAVHRIARAERADAVRRASRDLDGLG